MPDNYRLCIPCGVLEMTTPLNQDDWIDKIQHTLLALAEYGDNAILHVDWAEKEIQSAIIQQLNQARIEELEHVDPGARWFPHEDLYNHITVAERLAQLKDISKGTPENPKAVLGLVDTSKMLLDVMEQRESKGGGNEV